MSTTTYKGITVPATGPVGDGGILLINGLKNMADRVGPCHVSDNAPTINDDGVNTGGTGINFEVGSRWYQTQEGSRTEWVLLDKTTGHAEWVTTTLTTTLLNKVKSVQQQFASLPDNTWTEIAGASDSGVIQKIWMATDGPVAGFKIRITFDGASTPQIGGIIGIPLSDLFGAREISSRYRTDFWGQSIISGAFSGYVNLEMPFSTSFSIELLGPAHTYWVIAEYRQSPNVPNMSDPSMRLFAEHVIQTASELDEVTLFDQSHQCIFMGLVHDITGHASYYTLEGDYKFYYGSSPTLGYQSSGGEDFYDSSYYFDEGTYHLAKVGLLYKSGGRTITYRRWEIADAPADATRFKITWQNGQSGSGTAHTHLTRWYYSTQRTIGSPSVPASLTVNSFDSASVNLSWTGGSDAWTAGFKLYRDGVEIYDGMLTSFLDSGLTPSTSYTYTAKSYSIDGTLSSASSSAIQVTAAYDPTDGFSVFLEADGQSYSNNDPVTTWVDSSINGNSPTGGASPVFKTAQVNGLPAVYFNATKYLTHAVVSTSVEYTTVLVLKSDTTDGGEAHCAICNGNADSSGDSAYMAFGIRTVLHGGHALTNDGSGTTSWELWVIKHTASGGTKFRVNGVDQGAVTSDSHPNTPSGAFTVGSRENGNDKWNGYIAVAARAPIGMADIDIAALESYLMGKYGL